MTFDASKHLMKLKGKDYLEVKWRLVWFREEHPDWLISTEVIEHHVAEGMAVVKACIYADGDSRPPISRATGHKMETRKDFPDYLEKAETGAIGRALAALGYGTQFAPELDEMPRVVDAPVERKGYAPTDVREVEDNADIIRSADDELWKRWEVLRSEALGLGVKVPALSLAGGLRRNDLKVIGSEVKAEVVKRKQQLAAQDKAATPA